VPEALERAERWHRVEAVRTHEHVNSIVEWLWREQAPVRERMQRSLELYEGLSLPSLEATGYQNATRYSRAGDYDQQYWNVPRALVNAVSAKVAGRQRPKPSLVCTDADWATKRRAKRLERFAEATLHQPQGPCRDAWEVGTRMFVDCAVFSMGVLKVFADLEGRRIEIQRKLPWELLVDPEEAKYGAPLNIFDRYRYDKDRLAARFPAHSKAIYAAGDDEPTNWGSGMRIARACTVREAWRLPVSDGDKGKHAICIDGQTLLVEEWARDEFPFLIMRWAPHLIGWGAKSLVEEAAATNDELNFTIERMREGERSNAVPVVFYEEESIADEHIGSNKIGLAIPVRRAATKMPEYNAPAGYSESTLQWMRLHFEKCFELTGVSQMSASSRKEPGVTAGVALRAIAQMETERFSLIYTAYEQTLAVDLTRHVIACARDVASGPNGKDFKARWPGRKFLTEIAWSEADLEDDRYNIQPEAVPGLANTPADRLQLGQDLFNGGLIGPAAFLRITQMKDVDRELQALNVQHEIVDRYIEQWLEAEPEDEDEGTFRFRGPLPFMDHADAILQCARAYMQAELDGAPDWNLEHFTRFIALCDQMIKPPPAPPLAQAAQAPPGAPLPPPPGAGPAPMLN
jgi:hypothetical protein